jgi:glucose/arabinose dehydrogenase/mono/diheme cytochrome c family protein
MKKGVLFFCAVSFIYLNACNAPKTSEQETISVDSAVIAAGQITFNQDCSACHGFIQDGIGPQLGGVASVVSVDWIRNFLKDPKVVIESGDTRATQLYERYKTYMPSFAHYKEDKLVELIAFLSSKEAPDPIKEKLDPNALKNPIPEPIPMSSLVVDLKLMAEVPFSSEENPGTRITKLDFQPGTDNLFVLDLRGKLYYLNNNKAEVYLDMSAWKPNFIHKPGLATGFGSFAFHPEFAKNGLLYTTHAEAPGSGVADFAYADSIEVTLQWVLSEWKTNTPGAFPFTGESRELFRVNMVTGIHGMQEITFNTLATPSEEDYGLLYVGIGDGGSAETGYPAICGNKEQIWGTVLRIDPKGKNSSNGNYGIPKTNPFVVDKVPNAHGEIFAYGFRNPHRITWSRKGEVLVSNIGHHNIEALYRVQKGFFYGWPIREGTFLIDPSQNMHNIYPLPPDNSTYDVTYPVAQYDHDEGNAIAGGFEYCGKALPALSGKFLFGDIVKGRLFYVEMKDMKAGSQAPIKEWKITLDGVPKTLTELCGQTKVDERFGRDRRGELYITTKPDGKIYKLVSAQN